MSTTDNIDQQLNNPVESLIEKKRKEIKADQKDTFFSQLKIDDEPLIEEFEVFDGLAHINLSILLPKSYFDSIDELSERVGLTIKQWINFAVVKEINALRNLNNHILWSPVDNTFIAKYKIGQLSEKSSNHMIRKYDSFSKHEVVLSD
jgi:hypothetical protein